MKTQYKFSIVVGLICFLSFGLYGQIQKGDQIKSAITIDTVKINTEAAKGGGGNNETDAFDIGFQGGNFVAMPSPNSMTLVQQIEAGADLYTGKVQSTIPITSLSSYDISVPVTMSYSSNGIKVDDIGSWVGTGWDLQAGGKITRVMHNLPDEFNGILSDYDNGNLWDGEDRDGYGYLYLNQAVIDGNNIPFNLSTFYSNSQDDKQTIAKHADWQSCKDCEVALDTEPDEFYFSFGGYNGKFIFGQGGVINTIPNMNLEISKSINGNQQITQFEVKTPEGMIYTFGTTGSSLDGVETSRLTQTTLANRYEYKKIGADCTPWEIGDPGYNPAFPFAPCGEDYEYTYYYDIEPTLSYIDYTEGLSGIRANDWNIENADLTPNINHLEGKIRNSISKRLGFFSSTWHLKSISSPSGDFVTFNYEDESFRYTQSRNYTWEMPNFTLYENPYNGNSRFESKREPEERYENLFNLNETPEYYPEFASLIYSVSEITITGKRLSSIVASNNRSLEFVPTDADRVDLFGAKGLKEIEYKISNTRKKSWAFAYEEAISLVNASPNWSYVYAGAVILPTEDAIKLNAYNSTFSGSSPSVAEPYKYMQAFRSLCDVKHKAWDLYDPNNGTGITLEDYYDSEFTRLWKPEFNRFFLNIITEKGKNNEAIDLVDLDYYSQNSLPKRFSYEQDQFGFYNNNTRSTLLSKIPYDINLNDYRTFPFDDVQTSDDEFLGHQDGPNSAKARVGILRRIKYHTGANKSFEYSSNDYGVKLFAVNVSPAGTPDYKESYTYSSPIWMNQGGIDPNPSQGNGAELKRYAGIALNYEDDKWIMNSYQSRPGQMTKGSYKAYRRVNQSITDGNNQSLGRTQYHFSAVNTHPNVPPEEFWIWDNVDGAAAEYSYPFAPFTDVDYNRGVLDRVEVYDKNEQIISETINSWSFDYDTPTTIFGLQTAAIDRYEEEEGNNWVAHRADRYSFLSNRYRLESITQKHYEQDPNNSLDIVTSYTYNSNHDVASKSVSGGGVSQSTQYLRVSDIPGYATLFPEMVARNMTSPVWVTNESYGGNQVGGSKVDFKTNWTNCSGCILPWKTYSFEDSWELKSTVTSVNSHGQPLQIQREHYADPIIFVWEPDGLLDLKRYADWLWDYEYDDDRLLLSMTDVDAQVTTYGYDGFGKLDKIEERFGERNTDIVYGYGGIGGSGENFVKSTTTASGVAFIPPSKEVFDGLGRSLETTQEGYTPSSADLVSSQVYDAFGRVTTLSDPLKGASILYEYEDSPRSRIIEQSAQGSVSSVFFKYELNTSADLVVGHSPYTLYKTTTVDENGYPSETYKDVMGRTILLRKKVDGSPVETYYQYNNKGLLENITQPNGELFEYDYYPDRLLLSKSIPGGGTTEYTYNDKNQLETTTDANGNVLTYMYNKYDQPTRTLLDGEIILNNTYHDSGMGNKGRLHQTFAKGINTGGTFTTTLLYDKFGRVVNETRQHPVANDAYVYTYDHRDLTETVNRTHGASVNISKTLGYDHGGRLKSADMVINGSFTERLFYNTYNENDWLIKKDLGTPIVGSLGSTPLQSVDYKYNGRGWLTHINDVGECNLTSGPNIPQIPQDDGGLYLTNDGTVNLSYNAQEIIQDDNTNILMAYNMDMSYDGDVIFNVNNTTDINIGGVVAANSTNYTHNREYILQGEIDEEAMAIVMTNDIRFDAESLVPDGLLSDTRGNEIKDKIKEGIRDNPTRDDCLNEDGDLFAQQIVYNNNLVPILNNKSQFNGNISMIKWRVMVPGRNYVDYYGYEYDGVYDPSDLGLYSSNDGLNRFQNATYVQRSLMTDQAGNPTWSNLGRYNVGVSYEDGTGNIGSITRNGVIDETGGNLTYGVTDDLSFDYYAGNANRLWLVNESENDEHGFLGSGNVYFYDANGNIERIASSEGNTFITYNHFNLPNEITTPDGSITYLYDAIGRRLTKIGEEGTRDYVDGIEYVGGAIESIFNEGGRYLMSEQRFEYILQDHLGNSRVMFSDVNNDNVIDPDEVAEEVVQENHYYPFGMNMEGDWTPSVEPFNNYLYNGKENHNDFGLNWLSFEARFYDPAIARFTGIDPIGEDFAWATTYNYAENEPIANIDLWGLQKFYAVSGEYIGQYGTSSEIRMLKNNLHVNFLSMVINSPNGMSEKSLDYYMSNSRKGYASRDEAAVDWVYQNAGKSHKAHKEYGAAIYSKTVTGGDEIFALGKTEIGKIDFVSPWSSTLPKGEGWSKNMKGFIHTHIYGENFSPYENPNNPMEKGDEHLAGRVNGLYLATPGGKLKYLEKFGEEVRTLDLSIPRKEIGRFSLTKLPSLGYGSKWETFIHQYETPNFNFDN